MPRLCEAPSKRQNHISGELAEWLTRSRRSLRRERPDGRPRRGEERKRRVTRTPTEPQAQRILEIHRIWRAGRVAEGAPLLRVYRLIPYRGFESLALRHLKQKGHPFGWPFCFSRLRARTWFEPRDAGRSGSTNSPPPASLRRGAQRRSPRSGSEHPIGCSDQSLALRHAVCELETLSRD